MMIVGMLTAQASFEVASVKVADPKQGSVDFRIHPGGRLSIANATLDGVIAMAFGVKPSQMKGGPGWLTTHRFNIEAKAEGEPARPEMMLLLQNLLRARFGLEVHRESRDGMVYSLVELKGGHKCKPSTATVSHLGLRRNTPQHLPGVSYTIQAERITMARFASELAGQLDAPVSDRTGLPGDFDFELDFAIDDKPESGPSLFTAVQEQLGLKLVALKGPVEVLVIDRVGKPTEN